MICNSSAETVLSSSIASLLVRRPRLNAHTAHMPIGNAKPHNSRLSIQKWTNMDSSACRSRPIFLTWHLVTSSCLVD
jgi:hypothetical protein